MLEDIATLSGGQVISEDLFTRGWGIKLEKVTLDMLGRAKCARETTENTTIIDGVGKTADIQGRVAQRLQNHFERVRASASNCG